MYSGITGFSIPEQILSFVVTSENFKFVQQLSDNDYQTWLAYEISTGRTCIAKRFLMNNQQNLELHKYYQEVTTISQIDDFFASSFIGFTTKKPYCIFTEYTQNSSLYRALHVDQKAFPLTGSHKTMIAMGIAYGMMKIQQMKMIEPYLCSSNIYLTKEFLPKICHFNTINEPIKWKAPELIVSVSNPGYNINQDDTDDSDSQNDYYKSDVFAYGLILHELLTQKDSFYSISPDRAIVIVCSEKKRPSIPKNAPMSLQKLIRNCWNQNPRYRPSFSQIYESFESNEVMFPHTNPQTIEALRKRIKSHEKSTSNIIKMERCSQDINYLPQESISPVSTRSLSPHSRKSSHYSSKYDRQSMTPNQSSHHHRHRHRSVNRADFNFFDNDKLQSQNNNLSDASKKRRSHSAVRNNDYKIQSSLNNDASFSNNNSADNSFSNTNSVTATSFTPLKSKTQTNKNDDYLLRSNKRNEKASTPKAQFLNLKVFQDCYKQIFFTSLKNLPQKIHPSQYSQFFRIISKYFSADYSKNVIFAICQALIKLFADPEAMKEFINQNLHNLLPKDDQELIRNTFEILYLLFDFSPQSFQDNFAQAMSMLIRKNPEKALTLLSLFAKSFDKMEDPWSLLDLLFQHTELYLKSNVGSEYITLLFFLNFSFTKFSQQKMDQTRPVLVRFLHSSDKCAVSMTYRAICSLYDEYFRIPLDIMAKDLIDPDMRLLAISVMLRMKESELYPSKRSSFKLTEIILPLIKIAESHEEATLLLLRYLKNIESSKILLNNTMWLTKNLPTIQQTLKIFISLMIHTQLRDFISNIESLPEFFASLLKSGVVQCVTALQSIIAKLNLKKSIFQSLIEHQFFNLLFDSFGVYNNDKVTLSNLEILAYFAKIGETTEYLKFSDCLKTLIWSKNEDISQAVFKCLYRMSFYQQCAYKYKKMNLDKDILDIFKHENENQKVQTFLQNLGKVEMPE